MENQVDKIVFIQRFMKNNFSHQFLIAFLLVAAVLGAGCTTMTNQAAGGASVGQTDQATQSATAASNAVTTGAGAAFRIDFKTELASVAANAPANLIFTVKDRAGKTVKDLQIVHEKPMHLLVVSSDLTEFYHVHPEQSADGSYRVQHNFPNGGDYRLYADFTPFDSTQVVEQINVRVAGAERPKTALVADANLNKTVNGLRVELKPDGALRAKQDLMLNFRAFDAASGKPATDLQNYLGELAHFVIISEDMRDFVHAHPMSKTEHAAGGNHHDDKNAKPHSHDKEIPVKTEKAVSASEVAAHVAFPRAGLYKIWAQFQRGGQVIDVPFVVRVGEGETAAAVKPANVPADAIKVTVSDTGYEPASINAVKGQPVKIAFYRKDADNCGGEVIFPQLNVRKKLPVGETMVVEVTPQESGELAFSCGMNMYKGKVVVSN